MMKKTLHIVFAVILLFSLSACGKDNKISEHDKDGISNLANKKIECCDIFEYGEYVYYILPSEDNYLYDDVICRMKNRKYVYKNSFVKLEIISSWFHIYSAITLHVLKC